MRENVFKIGKKKREEKKDTFKFLDQSSVSSVGQETIKLMNEVSLTSGLTNNFSLFNNSQMSLASSLVQPSLSSSIVSSSNLT